MGEKGDYSDLHLCDSKDFDSKALYVTLSHCWGPKGVLFKLERTNHSALSERIPISALSQTFKDAIDFTRRLQVFGVKYIWIDALCIVQDSEGDEDWRDQARIMGEIYGSSFCNLAATVGPDGSSGFGLNLDRISRHVCTIKAGINSCLSGCFGIQNRDIFRSWARVDTILSRGWCVQELALAPRVLYFGRGCTAWDCSTLTAEEGAPTRQMTLKDGYAFTGRKHRGVSPQSITLRLYGKITDKTPFEYYLVWMNIVRVYSLCALTRHTDRLIAISGIARLIHKGLGPEEEYIAGLWKQYLPFHLIWKVSVGPRENFQLWPYRAPSWSWASVDGVGVYNHLTNVEAISGCVPFIKAHAVVEFENTDQFGAIKSAVLHVQGPVFKAFLGPRGQNQAKHLCKLFVNQTLDSRNNEPELVTNGPAMLDINYPGPEPVTVYCLVVMTTAIEGGLAGLILVRQDDSSICGRYIRIGVFYNLRVDILPRVRGSWRLDDREEYEREEVGGDYRISII